MSTYIEYICDACHLSERNKVDTGRYTGVNKPSPLVTVNNTDKPYDLCSDCNARYNQIVAESMTQAMIILLEEKRGERMDELENKLSTKFV